MKKHLLFNQSFGTVGSPNQTDETLTRENRIGLMSYLRRTLMLLFAVLVMSIANIGMAWGADKYYILGAQAVASDGALTKASSHSNLTLKYIKYDGSTYSNTTDISFSATDGINGKYESSAASANISSILNSAKWGTGSSSAYAAGIKFAKNTTYTLSLGSKTITKISFLIYPAGKASSITIGGTAKTTSSQAWTLHEWTGSFTGNVSMSLSNDNGVYGVFILETAAASDWQVKGLDDGTWAGFNMTGTGTVSVSRSLEAKHEYDFKLYNTSTSKWWGNGTTYKMTQGQTIVQADAGANCKLRTSKAGTYTFSFNTSTNELTVTYPDDYKGYWTKNGASWSKVYAYCYNDGTWKNAEWPGVEITDQTEDICGTHYYINTSGYTTVIFNNGESGVGNQTGNIAISGGEGKHAVGAAATTFEAFPTYTVTYDGNGKTGGSVPTDSNSPYACSSTVTVLGNTGSLVKTGYNFTGWNTADNGSGAGYTAGNTFSISENTTLYAQWELIPTYDVIYNTNGGTGGSTASQTGNLSGAQVTTSANGFTKTGYKFKWWNTAANGSGEDFYPGEKVTIASANVNLYAQWEEVPTDWAYWVGDVAFSDNKADVTGNGVTMRLTNNGGAWNTDVSQDKNRVSRYNNTTDKHAKVLAVDANNEYLQVHFTDGSPINTLSLGVVNTDASTANGMIVIYSTTADFSSGSGEKVEHNSPGYRQATKSMTDFSPSVSNTYYYARIYRDVSTAVYGFTGGSEKTIRIYAVKAEKGQVCNAPSALTAATPTAKGITLSVTDANNVNNYEFYVSTESTAPEAGATATHSVSSAKSLTITNLVAGTTYYAWARSVCGVSNKSGWTALTGNTFTTSTVTVTHTLTNVTKTSGATTAGGSDYTAVYTADAEYSMPTPTVTIDGNTATSGTDYTWSVDGSVGTITIPANKINGNIVITLNSVPSAPSSAAISGTYHYFPGENISLTVTPTGNNGPTTYQWYKGGKENGNAIEGATSATYTKNSCTFDDAGSYYCKVTCNATSIWAVTNSHENYDVKILRLYVKGSKGGQDYGNVDFVKVDGTTATASIALGSNWTYGFNIADGCGHYYGNAGTMQYNNYGPWVTDVDGTDCGLTTTNAATYIFTINYSNISRIETSVTFPVANQASGKVIYFDNNVLNWTGSSIYYRIGHSSHSQADQLSLVPGTANLYKMTTREYNNFSAWQIGNAAGDNGSGKSIYNTKNAPAITASIAYEGGAVTADAVTVTPGSDHSTGGDEQNNNCQFYSKTITSGMKTDRVTISQPSNGTITINYTNENGVPCSRTAVVADMNEDLAHTVILTSITTSPNEGYDAGTITINGGAYSANYVVTGATTIAATFTPQTYSITYKDQGGADFSGSHAAGHPTTHTYGTATTLKTASKTGYTFGGWYGNSGCTGAAMTSIGATSITAGIILYAKWTPAATLYTVTFNSNGGSTTPDAIEQASENASITMPAAPSYSGYTFQGWVIGGTTYAAGASYTPTADITAYASWKETCAGGGGGGSGATLFSQNFNSATTIYVKNTTNVAKSLDGTNGINILGSTAASQFTSFYGNKKSDAGFGLNNTNANDTAFNAAFGVYANNTGYKYCLAKTTNFSATPPTAIKVVMHMKLKGLNGQKGAAVLGFAVGSGFTDKTSMDGQKTDSIHSAFSFNNHTTNHTITSYNTTTSISGDNVIADNTEVTITWVINNSGIALNYSDPTSGETELGNDKFDVWVGSTKYVAGQSANNGAKALRQLIIGDPSGKKHVFTLNDITVTDLSPAGGGCYYVTYDGNGAEAGSISDATAHTSGSNVTVLGNTGGSAFTKTGYRFNGWNTSATGKGTAYAAGGTISSISADVTLYAQWVLDACSAPAAPTISGTSVRTVGQTITLNAACATGADASTTYTWYKGVDWATAFAALPVQEALTAEEGGRIFDKASCVAGDAGTYWCEASNGDDCEAHNATGFAVTVNAAVEEHIYYYKDANHYSEGTYSNPEGNEAVKKDNQSLSSPWMICNGCKAGVDSVVAHGATYDGKDNYMNAYIKLPTGGNATTKNIKFALTAGYTGTLSMKIGGYSDNPTVTLQLLNTSTGELGDAIAYTGTVGGVATIENPGGGTGKGSFNTITWNLSTAGGTYVLTVTSKTGYISQIDMTTATTATFNVTYDGNDKTGGTVPTDATNYSANASVTVQAQGTMVKDNYTFGGWNTANNGTGTNYVAGSGTFSIKGATTLYAHWTQSIYLAPGAKGSGTNGATVSWNGTAVRGFTAHTAAGYSLTGYYTETSGGTKVLNADGSFAATNVTDYITDGKWSRTGAEATLYAQWSGSAIVTNTLNVGSKTWGSSITTTAPLQITDLSALAGQGGIEVGGADGTGVGKGSLSPKVEANSGESKNAGEYMELGFTVAPGYRLRVTGLSVIVRSVSNDGKYDAILSDGTNSIEVTGVNVAESLSSGANLFTSSYNTTFEGDVTLKIWGYSKSSGKAMTTYRYATPIAIYGAVEETCTPPTFSGLDYSATEYTQGDPASAISVTGAANVDSYQWKYSTVNDRTSGTNCGTGASVTPSTASTGTLYYWCELTKTTCTTVKTPTVAITVTADMTEPTVTWSDVKLNGAATTVNYGGGKYELRATVNETGWSGTLASSMITAPAGIYIHNIGTGTEADKKYIEFQFDVTTAFDREENETIGFHLSLPAISGTPNWNALTSDKQVSYTACDGGEGEGGMIYLPLTETQTTAASGMKYYWETAGSGRLASQYGGSAMGSTLAAEPYHTADHDFPRYAASTGDKWMFQTYVGGVNKVRVVFRAGGALKSSNLTISKFCYDTEYFSSQGDRQVSIGEVSPSKASFASGEDGYMEFTVPEMAANSYAYFQTGSSNIKIYGIVLYSESSGSGGTIETDPTWTGGLNKDGSSVVERAQGAANFTYTISTTTNTLGGITYSSSNPSVAEVNATTGEVRITATGSTVQTAVITATLARSGCYQPATRTYTVSVTGNTCTDPIGTIEAEDLGCSGTRMTFSGYADGATIQWYKNDSPIADDGGDANVYTATEAGNYYAVAHLNCDRQSNSILVTAAEMDADRVVEKWYIKNGRLTPDIKLWTLDEGSHLVSVAWSPTNATGLDQEGDIYESKGAVYLTGRAPSSNDTGEDKSYTLTLTINNGCTGTGSTVLSDASKKITIIHQKNTDKHVLAFVVGNTEMKDKKYVAIGKGFTESIPASQTTNVSLYNEIAKNFDVQATNIYSTDDEQKIKEYYSQFDIICITDYPNTKTKGSHSVSFSDAIGVMVDIRPVLTMEAWVSGLSNWNKKGISGDPKSPTTRQYTMLLQCKDHEIFTGTTLTKVGEGEDAMYRVTMVDKNKEEYKTLDANYGDGEHKANEGYQYGKKPALQGFTFSQAMLDADLLPLGLIDDGAGNDLQVGLERQREMSARMMVLGINSTAMERLTADGERVVINALNYLMKKNAEDIADCSTSFVGGAEGDGENWMNADNWTGNTVPDKTQKVRILAPCVVPEGEKVHVAGVLIAPNDGGTYNGGSTPTTGSLTIAAGGALVVDGKIQAVTAPAYNRPRATSAGDLAVLANSDGNGTLIFDNGEGETKATIQMYSKAIADVANNYAGLTWQYVAVPYSDNNNAHHNYYDSWLYAWAADNSGWKVVPNRGNVYPWIGYCITQDAPKTYTMDGTLVETSQQEFTVPAGVEKVIGNSWTAPLQVKQFTDDDFGSLTKNIYLFNTGYDPNGEGKFDKADGRYEGGTYVTIPIHSSTYTGDSLVSSLQAFFVKNESGSEATLTLDYDRHVRPTRSTDNVNAGPMHAPSRFIASDEPTVLKIWASGSRYDDRLILLEREDFSTGYDAGWDGDKWKEGDASPRIYTIMESGEEAITATPELEGTIIGFRAGEDNSYTLRFEYNESNDPLYILDTENRIYTRVLTDQTYQFTTNDKAAHSRFVLTRTDGQMTPTGIDDVQGDKVHEAKAKKFIMDDKMYILFNGRVFDATGKAVK